MPLNDVRRVENRIMQTALHHSEPKNSAFSSRQHARFFDE